MSDSATKSKIDSLQLLRAFAALLVVFHHSKDFSIKYGHTNWLTSFLSNGVGAFGVDIFFVLSGFIMFATTRSAIDGREFLLKRAARVAPMYWAVTTLLAALLFLAPGMFGSIRFSLWHYILSLLFIPHNSPSGDYLPLLGVGWTLCFEMYFYLVFAAIITTGNKKVAIISCYMATMVGIGFWIPTDNNKVIWTLTSSLNIEFALGVILARLSDHIPKNTYVGAFIAMTGVLLAYIFRDMGGAHKFRGLTWGTAATMTVFGFIMLSELRLHRALTLLGDASYSLYLIHMLSLPFAWKVANATHMPINGLAVTFFAIAFSVALSILLWKHIESPLSERMRQIMLDKRATLTKA